MLVGKKNRYLEILPHLPWFEYELCLVVMDALMETVQGK